MLLSGAGEHARRFYSMSSQIRKERNACYDIMEQTQKGTLDITGWLVWFLKCLNRAISNSNKTLSLVFKKAKFWDKHAGTPINAR